MVMFQLVRALLRELRVQRQSLWVRGRLPVILLVGVLASAFVGGCQGSGSSAPLRGEDYTKNDFPFMLSRINYVPRMDAHKLKLRGGAELLGTLTTVRSHVEWSEYANPGSITRHDWTFSWLGFDHVPHTVYRSLHPARPHMDELRDAIVEGVPRATFMSPGEFDVTSEVGDPYLEAFGGYGPKHWSALCTLHFSVAGQEECWQTRVSVSLAVFFRIGEVMGEDVEVIYHVVVFSEESINTILVFPSDISERILGLCAKLGAIYVEAGEED
jgi:hypothetical protein